MRINANGKIDIYVARGKFSAKYSLTATPNGKSEDACTFSLGRPVFRPYWNWNVGRDFISVTVGSVVGTVNLNVDGAWTSELRSRFVWYKPWTALDWGITSKMKLVPFAKFNLWSDGCCKCYTVTAAGEKASFSFEIIPGHVVGVAGLAVAATKLPAFANGVGQAIKGAVGEIIDELPDLLPQM